MTLSSYLVDRITPLWSKFKLPKTIFSQRSALRKALLGRSRSRTFTDDISELSGGGEAALVLLGIAADDEGLVVAVEVVAVHRR